MNNFEQLLDQALAEFASQELNTSEKQSDFKKYADFLQEISDEDEDLAKTELSSILSIEDDKVDNESNFLLDEVKNNPNGWFNKSSWVFDNKISRYIRKDGGELFVAGNDDIVSIISNPEGPDDRISEAEKKQRRINKLNQGAANYKKNRDLRKIEINRMAFDQKLLPLSDKITVEHKRLVIELLTKPLRTLLIKYKDYIDNRVTKLLAPAIPAVVKLAAIKWPWIFIPNPGFMYKTSSHYGEVKSFWVTPKLPYFFKQGTEQTVLEERDAALSPYFLDCIDRAIHRYYDTRDKLAQREVYYASRMLSIKGNTYYHLLMLNPFWFEKLYKYVEEKEELL